MLGLGSVRRPSALLAVLALAAAGVISGVAPASPVGAQGGPPEQVLERDMRGEAAIQALGDRLPEVAARNDMTPTEFRDALRADSMLWVDRTGRLLFVDEFLGHDEAAMDHGTLDDASLPVGTDVTKLHSRPGAQRVIVLDFDGHDARGSAWGNSPKQNAAAYNSDGIAGFSASEQAVIFSVWQRVAEDYAPFDVDVTTQDPGTEPNGVPVIRRKDGNDPVFGTRVVVTPTQAYPCSCGGVAYVGVYDNTGTSHDHYQPAWVFTGGVGHGAKNIAEAASHEAGHNLGLQHDGGTGTGYYRGHGDWAPIMGVGYYEPTTQWSKGEYSGANNTEDDFAVMASHGATPAPDDHPSSTPLAVDGSVDGVIETEDDTDTFSVTATSEGTLVIHARPAAVSPNLDLALSTGAMTSDLASSALDATISVPVIDNQTVEVVVDGVGFGTADTGYTDYGSVGRYTLTASMTAGDGGGVTPDPDPPPTASAPLPPEDLEASVSGSTVSLTWTDASSNEDGFRLERSYTHPKNGQTRTTVWTVPAGTTGYEDPGLAGATYTYRIQSYNAAGASTWVTTSATVEGGGGKPSKGGNRAR